MRMSTCFCEDRGETYFNLWGVGELDVSEGIGILACVDI